MVRKQPATKCVTRLSVRSAARGSPMDAPALLAREEVLRELERLAQGRHPDQQTPLMRFTRCPDWQQAAELIVGALNAASHHRKGNRLSAPPGWLPPVW